MRTEYWIVIGILCYAAFMVFHGFSNFKHQNQQRVFLMRTAVLILLYSFVPLRFPCTAVCPIMDIRPEYIAVELVILQRQAAQ